jgi:mono/diheme cytochrome c family protein
MPQLERQGSERLSVRHSSRSARVFYCIVGLLVLIVAAGCAGLNDNGTQADTRETMEARENASAAPESTPAAGEPAGTATTGAPPAAAEGDPAIGQQVYQSNCVTCHTIDGGQGVGPTWQGMYGSQITLESGETVTADDAYIRESILQPNAKVHQGFPPAMPTFSGVLSDEQIAGVIAFIRTLE